MSTLFNTTLFIRYNEHGGIILLLHYYIKHSYFHKVLKLFAEVLLIYSRT